MKAEDDKPEPGRDPRAGSLEPAAPGSSDSVTWSEEETRLLGELRRGAGPDSTETIRRLVVGILRQARFDLGGGGVEAPDNRADHSPGGRGLDQS